MAPPTTGSPNLYALLIGIDCYLPNALPDGVSYRHLRGCVRDVRRVQDVLVNRVGVPPSNITALTSTNDGKGKPIEKGDCLPSYANMVAAFKRLTEQAQAGDLVYVHYSGHGGRAATAWPALKGAAGVDEALVPYDIGNKPARYLRDVELATLLKAMVDKGLVVAVVVDSCHSGGMVRGRADAAVRGVGSIDTTPPPPRSSVGPRSSLETVWQELTAGGRRDVTAGSGWLPEPRGYTLLAACRPSESAYEYPFDGQEREGALTHWFLDSLRDLGPNLTYKIVHDRIVAKIHSQFENQTPQLQGEGDRVVFGAQRVQPVYAVTVMRVETGRGRVLLGAGQSQMVREGAQFAIFPHGTTDFTDASRRLALVQTTEVGAETSWAKITKTFATAPIEQGAQAVLLSGGAKLVRKVSLVRRTDIGTGVDQDAALAAVEAALVGNAWVEVATRPEEVEYQVAVNEQGEYEIWDRAGKSIANIAPPLAVGEPQAPTRLVNRLVHLVKYHALAQFRNHDELSPLAGKLLVELVGRRDEYDPADPFVGEPFADPGQTPTLRVGEWTALRIKNRSPYSLNITVLNLRPSWAVRQVYPAGAGDYFVEFAPGQEKIIPLRADLAAHYTTGRDILKVFATKGTANYRWLELPPLDETLTRSASVRGKRPASPLEQLFAAFTADRPPARDLNPGEYPSHEWTTEQVEIWIVRE